MVRTEELRDLLTGRREWLLVRELGRSFPLYSSEIEIIEGRRTKFGFLDDKGFHSWRLKSFSVEGNEIVVDVAGKRSPPRSDAARPAYTGGRGCRRDRACAARKRERDRATDRRRLSRKPDRPRRAECGERKACADRIRDRGQTADGRDRRCHGRSCRRPYSLPPFSGSNILA